jgi:glycosyltransferase involved in cell wall biosynthesis
MAASIPVVATRVGGNPETIDASTGMLVPARAETALGEALMVLARDAGRRARMGAAARLRVESAFSAERMYAEYLASYRAHVRAPGRRAAG